MIKNAEKIDYDIKSTRLTKAESEELSKTIADYKKRKALKERKKKKLSYKAKSSA
jgi:hypothetical protein